MVWPDMPVVEHPDNEIWEFAHLHYVPPMDKRPDALEALRRAVLGPGLAPPPNRRLFVSRGADESRRLVNETEIVALCERRGFLAVDPALLSLRDQAALFQSASVIVGVKGAAMTNAIFCRPGASMVLLSPDDFRDPFFWEIACSRGLRYAEMFGPRLMAEGRQGQNPFTVDPVRFGQFLNQVVPAARREDRAVPFQIIGT